MSPKKSNPPKEPFVSEIDRPEGVFYKFNFDAKLTELRVRDLAMILHSKEFAHFRKRRPDNEPLPDAGAALTELRACDLAMILHSPEEFPFRKRRPDSVPLPPTST